MVAAARMAQNEKLQQAFLALALLLMALAAALLVGRRKDLSSKELEKPFIEHGKGDEPEAERFVAPKQESLA